MDNILNINSGTSYDNSITKLEYHSYSPFLNSFNNNDEIRISIQQQDLYVLPSQSYIYIEGAIAKADHITSPTAKLVNNAVAFLFDEIRYELNGVEIDRTRNVGITSTIKNYLSLNETSSKMFYNAGWSPENHITPSSGCFNFCIPLKMFLGFAEDYKKIIINAKHELILNRSRTDDNALFSATDVVEFKIFKLQWRMPHVTVDDNEKLSLLKVLGKNQPIQMSFRSWDMYEYPTLPTTTEHNWTVKTSNQLEKPRYVILAFQTNRKNQKDKDFSKFDHCELSDVKLHLNSETFPYDDLNIKFKKNQFSLLYQMYIKFQESYYDKTAEPLLSWSDFKNKAPIIVIDCSRQNDSLKSGPVDIRLQYKTCEAIAANTNAYCLLLHDRIIQYSPLTNEVKKLV